MRNKAIEVNGITKKFGDFTAVDDISFAVEEGEIFGFLGPNGAGKTTTIRMLCGLMDPSGGEGKVRGFDIVSQGEKIKEIIGYMSQKFSLYEDLTVSENIDFYAGIYQTKKAERAGKKEAVLKRAELFGREKELTGNLATSIKQHLALGCVLIHDPEIVFLDEPTAGVDPLSRKKFWGIIRELAAKGVTTLVTTHYMDEAEHCDRIAMISAGRIIACDTPAELKRRYLKGALFELDCDNVMAALEKLKETPLVKDVSLYGMFLHVRLPDEKGVEEVKTTLEAGRLSVRRIERISPSLEDVFVSLIEEESAQRAERQ